MLALAYCAHKTANHRQALPSATRGSKYSMCRRCARRPPCRRLACLPRAPPSTQAAQRPQVAPQPRCRRPRRRPRRRRSLTRPAGQCCGQPRRRRARPRPAGPPARRRAGPAATGRMRPPPRPRTAPRRSRAHPAAEPDAAGARGRQALTARTPRAGTAAPWVQKDLVGITRRNPAFSVMLWGLRYRGAARQRKSRGGQHCTCMCKLCVWNKTPSPRHELHRRLEGHGALHARAWQRA